MASTQIKDGYSGGSDNQLKINTDGSLNATLIGTIPISGTVTANQGTSPWVVSGTVSAAQSGTWNIATVTTLTSITNPVAVTQTTSPWVVSGTVTANSGTNLNTSLLALDSTLTNKTQFTKLTDGTDTALVTSAGEQNVLATAQPGVDIGDVTINNASGASAVNIQDGGNSITVDGTVTAAASTGTLTDRSGTAGASSAPMMAANSSRKYLLIENVSSGTIYFNFTSTATAGSGSIALLPNSAFVMESSYVSTEAINVIRSGGSDLAYTAKEG